MNPFAFDIELFRDNVRKAATEDLLDRVTVYRAGMEPLAVDLIEAELRNRGVWTEYVEEYGRLRDQEVIFGPGGVAQSCTFCRSPAVAEGWTWHRLWGK